MPALSIATSVPVPMAMPTSAAASAGASLTPSPAMATTRPSRRSRSTHVRLVLRQHLGLDLVDAELRATACAVVRLSPVSMTMRMPSSSQRGERGGRRRLHRIGDGDDAGELAVDRDEDRGRAVLAQTFGVAIERGGRDAELGRRTRHCRAPRGGARPCRMTPLPAGESKPSTRASAMLRSAAPPRRSRPPSGCSLARSTLAASRSTSASSKPGAGTMATTFGLPSVSVPVLSTTSVSTFSMRSSASAFLISTPACAPRPTPTMIDIGVARPSAQGQAMMSTLTAATSA